MSYKRKATSVSTYWNNKSYCPRCRSTQIKTRRYYYDGNGNGPKRKTYKNWCVKCGYQGKIKTVYY